MTEPRTATYRTGPASAVYHRDEDDHGYVQRHKVDPWTPLDVRVAAIVERCAR